MPLPCPCCPCLAPAAPARRCKARPPSAQDVDFINPLLSSRELLRLADHFHQHNALRLRSPAKALVWNTPKLARLRVLLHSALRPSARVAMYTSHVVSSMEKFAQLKGLSPAFVALQLPHGPEWSEYCRREARSAGAAEAAWRRCDLGAAEITQVLEERQAGEVSRLLYVATPFLNVSQIKQLHQQRFAVMTKARFTLEMQPDVASAVDLFVCKRAALYAGNMFSAFSYLQREGRLAAGEAERAFYYNMEADTPLDDLTVAEATRWNVLPFGATGALPAAAPS